MLQLLISVQTVILNSSKKKNIGKTFDKAHQRPILSKARFRRNITTKFRSISQLSFTCSKSTIEILEKGLKYV